MADTDDVFAAMEGFTVQKTSGEWCSVPQIITSLVRLNHLLLVTVNWLPRTVMQM